MQANVPQTIDLTFILELMQKKTKILIITLTLLRLFQK